MTWYAVHTKPRMEDVADIHLKRQGYRVFFPFVRLKRYVGRQTNGRRLLRIVDHPLFSRYIFVELSKPTQSLFAVNETYGVSVVVHIGGEPLEIPEGVIDELMARTDEEGQVMDERGHVIKEAPGLIVQEKEKSQFSGKPGDMLELDEPYKGLVAELASIAHLDKRDEISIFLEFLGSKREITIPAKAVAKVTAAGSEQGQAPLPRSAQKRA